MLPFLMKIEFKIGKKSQNLLSFVAFKRTLGKISVLKIAAQAFVTVDFLNIFLRFWVFKAHFLIKIFIIKKKCILKTM